MQQGKFQEFAMKPGHPDWDRQIHRMSNLYERQSDIRSPFARDYTRILHSMAYRRLKHKTQVFFNIEKDHICTRMEHVAHVESVSGTIARYLGLNDELTKAISMGHDLGHAPFGHEGEKILSEISRNFTGNSFWHERNGLRFVDHIELLPDDYNRKKNLDLTYAVRDGIISHCGEADENGLRPRTQEIDLEKEFRKPGEYQPGTWEGCVVKISDKIAYIGRDIEDAISLGFLQEEQLENLMKLAGTGREPVVNTTVLIHTLITDILENSSPESGILLSGNALEQLDAIKEFNYENIYRNPRFEAYAQYARLVLTQISSVLERTYRGADSFSELRQEARFCPNLMNSFAQYLAKYCEEDVLDHEELKTISKLCRNEKVYGRLDSKKIYQQAILDYVAGMTDRFAVSAFNELLRY